MMTEWYVFTEHYPFYFCDSASSNVFIIHYMYSLQLFHCAIGDSFPPFMAVLFVTVPGDT